METVHGGQVILRAFSQLPAVFLVLTVVLVLTAVLVILQLPEIHLITTKRVITIVEIALFYHLDYRNLGITRNKKQIFRC